MELPTGNPLTARFRTAANVRDGISGRASTIEAEYPQLRRCGRRATVARRVELGEESVAAVNMARVSSGSLRLTSSDRRIPAHIVVPAPGPDGVVIKLHQTGTNTYFITVIYGLYLRIPVYQVNNDQALIRRRHYRKMPALSSEPEVIHRDCLFLVRTKIFDGFLLRA